MVSFNTSHVVVYLGQMYFSLVDFQFQYISCCSLSWHGLAPYIYPEGFNTSHVVVYHINFRFRRFPKSFQYISCCSLSHFNLSSICLKKVSIHLMLQFILSYTLEMLAQYAFQYISCCSLSYDTIANSPNGIKFQYISCCSLSVSGSFLHFLPFGFNTSHVVVYRLVQAVL